MSTTLRSNYYVPRSEEAARAFAAESETAVQGGGAVLHGGTDRPVALITAYVPDQRRQDAESMRTLE